MKVLLIENDDVAAARVLKLAKDNLPRPVSLTRAESLEAAIQSLKAGLPDVILMGLPPAHSDSSDSIRRLREAAGEAPAIIVVGAGGEAAGLEAIQHGAQDYIDKEEIHLPGTLIFRRLRFAIERHRRDLHKKQATREIPSKKSIDPEAIDNLLHIGGDRDPVLFREMMDLFLKNTPPRLAKLQKASAAGDPKTLFEEAHGLKSSCAYLGASLMEEKCRELEEQGSKGSAAGSEARVKFVIAEFARVKAELERIYLEVLNAVPEKRRAS